MCFSSSVLSRRPNILKSVPKPSKIPSLLSAHAGSYIYCIKNANIDALRLNAVTPGAQAERNIYIYICVCAPLARNHVLFFEKCVPLLHETVLFCKKHRNPHAWIREQLSQSAHLPDPTHAGTKYPVRGNPSLRSKFRAPRLPRFLTVYFATMPGAMAMPQP